MNASSTVCLRRSLPLSSHHTIAISHAFEKTCSSLSTYEFNQFRIKSINSYAPSHVYMATYKLQIFFCQSYKVTYNFALRVLPCLCSASGMFDNVRVRLARRPQLGRSKFTLFCLSELAHPPSPLKLLPHYY